MSRRDASNPPPDDMPAQDPRLRAALRHAPDADLAPPPALSAAISAAAHAALRASAPPARLSPLQRLRRALEVFWTDLAAPRPVWAGGAAALVVAGLTFTLWVNEPTPPAVISESAPPTPRELGPGEARLGQGAAAPAAATAPPAPVAAAPVPLPAHAPAPALAPAPAPAAAPTLPPPAPTSADALKPDQSRSTATASTDAGRLAAKKADQDTKQEVPAREAKAKMAKAEQAESAAQARTQIQTETQAQRQAQTPQFRPREQSAARDAVVPAAPPAPPSPRAAVAPPPPKAEPPESAMSLADRLDRARDEAQAARKPAVTGEQSAELAKSTRNAFPGSPAQPTTLPPTTSPPTAVPAPVAPAEPAGAGPTRGGAVTGRVAQVPAMPQPSAAAPAPAAAPPVAAPVVPAPAPAAAPAPAPAAAPAPPVVAERQDTPLAASAPAVRAAPSASPSLDNRAAAGLVSRSARPPTLSRLLGPEAATLTAAERSALQVLDSVTRQRWQRRDERDASARAQPAPTTPAHWRGLRVEADAAYWTEPDGSVWVAPLSPGEATRLRALF